MSAELGEGWGSGFAARCGMSKNINVNPGQYKVAGRERQGEDTDTAKERAELAKKGAEDRAKAKAPANAPT